MTDAVTVALIMGTTGAIPATIAAVLGFLNSISIRRQARAMADLEKNTNHKMDQLLEVTGTAEHAKGKLEGAAEVHAARQIAAEEKP